MAEKANEKIKGLDSGILSASYVVTNLLKPCVL